MIRVRLRSGEEAVYRSVEELALGLQSGVVTPDAEVFDGPRGWQPLEGHPDYAEAASRARTPIELDWQEPPLPPIEPVVESGAPQILQIRTRSGKELEERRRRPAWPRHLMTAVAVAAGIVIVVGLARVTPEPPNRHASVRELGLSLGTRAPVDSIVRIDLSDVPAPLRSPGALAERYRAASARLGLAFRDSAGALGAAAAPRAGRLEQRDSIDQARAAVLGYRAAVQRYRQAQRALERAYRDTASYLARYAWTRAELAVWQASALAAEGHAPAARTDSLLDALEAWYAFLLTQNGRYEVDDHGLRFQDPSAALTFDRLRARLAALIAPPAEPGSPTPLRLLLEWARMEPLPVRVAR
jgi:hypothetical protein